MNNIIESNGASVSVNVITYFSSDNKRFVFYSKNEVVQNGLIKMYVGSIDSPITDQDWLNLKKIMQDIILGKSSVSYLNMEDNLKLASEKAIALNEQNINSIKNSYVPSGETNKDLLNSSFNTASANTTPSVEISPIPNVNNTSNLESMPVNFDTNNVSDVNIVPTINPISDQAVNENISFVPNTEEVKSDDVTLNNRDTTVTLPHIETINSTVNEDVLTVNSVEKPTQNSPFQVSNEPNIFDNPSEISNIKPVLNEEKKEDNIVNTPNVVVDNSKLIELNDRKIELFSELAKVYKEENELLKGNSNLDNTASNLFDSNGSLNENNLLN